MTSTGVGVDAELVEHGRQVGVVSCWELSIGREDGTEKEEQRSDIS